jgi:hypothetical protein
VDLVLFALGLVLELLGHCILDLVLELGHCILGLVLDLALCALGLVLVMVEVAVVVVEVGWCILVLMVEVAEMGVVEKKRKGNWEMEKAMRRLKCNWWKKI